MVGDSTSMISFLENIVSSLTPINISLIFMVTVIVLVIWRWHKDDNNFHLQQVLVDNTNGKIAIEKVGYMSSLAIGSWGFVALTQTGHMTEGYFATYLGVFALSRAASSGISVFKDVKMSQTTTVTGIADSAGVSIASTAKGG